MEDLHQDRTWTSTGKLKRKPGKQGGACGSWGISRCHRGTGGLILASMIRTKVSSHGFSIFSMARPIEFNLFLGYLDPYETIYGRKDSNSFYLSSIKIPGSSIISNVGAQFSPIPLKLASIQLDDFSPQFRKYFFYGQVRIDACKVLKAIFWTNRNGQRYNLK